MCVSGALVDLEFPFPFFPFFLISLSNLSLFANFPILFFFSSSCYVSFLSINLFHLHAVCLCPSYTRNSLFFPLPHSQLIWTGHFVFTQISKHTLIIPHILSFLSYFPFFCLRIWPFVQAKHSFRSPSSLAGPTKNSKSLCGVEHASLLPVDLQANTHY